MDTIASKLGSDILLLDIRGVSIIADYFVICSGESERQLHAIFEELRYGLEDREGISVLSTEGTESSGWILMDYGAVIVHIFSPERRRYYNLERLWRDGKTVVRLQ